MHPIISSAANPHIKQSRKLRESTAYRRKTGLCLAEGARLCRDALLTGVVQEFFATPEFAERQTELWEMLSEKTWASLIDPSLEKEFSETQNPQGVYAVVDTNGLIRELSSLAEGRILVLDRIADPSNMGTILRTAEAFGVSDIILTAGCCDVFSPKVLRGSMGGAFRLKLYPSQSPASDIQALQEKGRVFYAAVPDAEAASVCSLPALQNGGLVIGNEAEGISAELLNVCLPVTIPMAGRAESLNAAIAAGILIWELFGKQSV